MITIYNKIILLGRLTADPELRYTPSGAAVAKFTLAVDRSFKNQSGEKEADFIDHVAWNKLAETCSNYLKKGSKVLTEGRLQIRSYEDNQGIRRKAAEVVVETIKFLDGKRDNAGSGSSNAASNATGQDSEFMSEISYNDDNLPF